MENLKDKHIEIMSPVGSFESLMAALQSGAGSVYFGIGKLNMRSRSSVNFTIADLKQISEICKEHNVKTYLTLNTVIYDEEINEMKSLIDAAKTNGITAIIASDMSVISYARSQNVEVHISTQCNITNIDAVRYYSQFADVMVTARELTLKQVGAICRVINEENICGPSGKPVQIEVFVHGALCMAISGKCYLSLDNMNYSANRGACLQLCRRSYLVTDKEEGFELEIDNEYIMSPKDLCTIGFLDKILSAGITVLKIEGRGRSPEYVKTVTQCYKQAVDAIQNETYTQELIEKLTEKLKSVFNRGFWNGYYLGRKLGEWTEKYGSQATKTKVYCGKISNYFKNLNVAEIKIETGVLNVNDEVIVIGPTTGVVEFTIQEIRLDLVRVNSAAKGERCSIPIPSTVRKNDKLYILKSEKFY
jgi:U32 family peptidase